MHTRDMNLADLVKIEKYHDHDFQIPNPANKLFFLQKAIVSQDELIGAAYAHKTTEVSLILKPDIANVTKARAIQTVFRTMLDDITGAGFEDTHVFITPDNDEAYAQFLISHFNFVKAKGIPMYYQKR